MLPCAKYGQFWVNMNSNIEFLKSINKEDADRFAEIKSFFKKHLIKHVDGLPVYDLPDEDVHSLYVNIVKCENAGVIKAVFYDLGTWQVSEYAKLCGQTRQSLDHILIKKRTDLDFKKMREDIKGFLRKDALPSPPETMEGEEWKKIKTIDGYEVVGECYISNMGRFKKARARNPDVIYIANIKADLNGRVRASLNVRPIGKKTTPVPKTFYINVLVGLFFLPQPKDTENMVVSPKDGNYSNVKASNLFWESKTDNFLRVRSTSRKNKKNKK